MLTEYRGKKLGARLFNEVGKWAVKNNITRLELTVIKNNEAAVKLYERNGFKADIVSC